jgi:hypothetical protein
MKSCEHINADLFHDIDESVQEYSFIYFFKNKNINMIYHLKLNRVVSYGMFTVTIVAQMV